MSLIFTKSVLPERSDRELHNDINNSSIFSKNFSWSEQLDYILRPKYHYLEATSDHTGCLNSFVALSRLSKSQIMFVSKDDKLVQNS